MRRRHQQHAQTNLTQARMRLVFLSICIGFLIVFGRLFFWQIVMSSELKLTADNQYLRSFIETGSRGQILAADGAALVTNQEVYRLFAQPKVISEDPQQIAHTLVPILLKDNKAYQTASTSAEKLDLETTLTEELITKLSNQENSWTSLVTQISESTKNEIANQHFAGIGFDAYEVRAYPEASMAAHLTGFVGKDEAGSDVGYFGIEGALEQELKARFQEKSILADAHGNQLNTADNANQMSLNGRDVTTTIRRDIQHLAETALIRGMEKYAAKAGEVVILDPANGDLLALAVEPKFNQQSFFDYPPSTYANPSLTSVYEPGSTFKLLTVASGIDTGVISPDTVCSRCSGPRIFGKYTIRTWNDVYHPNITMTEALAKSDNTAMIFAAEQIGAENFRQYVQNFGIGEALHIDLQGDLATPFPDKWGPVELATISFGQGISTTSLQLVRAVATIANDGQMMRPRIVKAVSNSAGEWVESPPIFERQVISKHTADQVSEMMVAAAEHGEAQWIASKSHRIAGKTGTSQIATGGSYDEEKTIASFIGFAPINEPKFVMLVKLVEPDSSPWAAETAAPLWYQIAHDLFLMMNIPPDSPTADVNPQF